MVRLTLGEEGPELDTQADVAWIYALKGLATRSKYGLGARFSRLSEGEAGALSAYLTEQGEKRRRQSRERREKVLRILAKIARLSPEAIHEDASIREQLGFDSLMAVEALAAFETVFGIEIDESRAFDLATVADILHLLDEYLAEEEWRPEDRVRLV